MLIYAPNAIRLDVYKRQALMRMPGVGDLINSGYQYDRDNQLVFESRDCFGTDASTTFYEYDNFGNITWVRTFRGNGYEGISDADVYKRQIYLLAPNYLFW